MVPKWQNFGLLSPGPIFATLPQLALCILSSINNQHRKFQEMLHLANMYYVVRLTMVVLGN